MYLGVDLDRPAGLAGFGTGFGNFGYIWISAGIDLMSEKFPNDLL